MTRERKRKSGGPRQRRAQQEAEEVQKEKDKHVFNEALMKAAYDLMLKKQTEMENEPAAAELEEEDKVGEEPAD